MLVQEMAQDFKLGAKRIDGINAPDTAKPTIVSFLNRGMMSLLKKRYGPDNKYGATLESIQKRIDEWQRLIVPHEIILCTPVSKSLYTVDLTKAQSKYLFLLRISFEGENDTCKGQKIRSYYSSSDDLDKDLDNPNSNPNFGWRETLHRFAQDKILAYTDSTFSLKKANIDYLRYPKLLDLSGYKHFDSSASADVQCELPDFLHTDIVDEAVLLYKLRLNHPDAQSAAVTAERDD